MTATYTPTVLCIAFGIFELYVCIVYWLHYLTTRAAMLWTLFATILTVYALWRFA